MARRRWRAQHYRNMESLTLQEREEEKERGTLHPKSRSKRRKVNSLPFLHFFRVCVFFSYLKRRRQHYFLLSHFCFLLTSLSYLFMHYCCNEEVMAASYRCILLCDTHPSSLLDSRWVQVGQIAELFEVRGMFLALNTRRGKGVCWGSRMGLGRGTNFT
jgi:hypothetical protein